VLRSLAFKGYHLESLNFNEFSKLVDGYQSADNNTNVGVPTTYMVWANEIWLHPIPSISESNSINIYSIKHPATITTLADELGLRKQYHNAILKYCMSQAYELDENMEAKQMKDSEFSTDVQKLNDRNKWTNQEVY